MASPNGKGGTGGNGKNNENTHGDDGSSTTLKGGRGDDTYHVTTLGTSVDEKNNGGLDTVLASVDYFLDPNVENLELFGENDLVGGGNELDNGLSGNIGANLLSGFEGNDIIFGHDGDDTLSGGSGSDEVNGGLGFDTAVFEGVLADYSISVEEGYILVTSTNGDQDRLSDVEMLSFMDYDLLVTEIVPPDPPPGAPSAQDDFAEATRGSEIVLAVLANDVGEGLAIAAVTDAVSGVVTINEDNTISYTPSEDASGQDTFSYTVVDEFGQTATADVVIDILSGNTAPVAANDWFSANSGETYRSSTSILANDTDADGDLLNIATYDATSTSGGSVEVNADGTFIYTSATGFVGTDSFGYSIDDGQGGVSDATVTIDVADGSPTEIPYYVTGLIRGEEYRFNPDDPIGTEVTVTFSFAQETPSYYHDGSFAWIDFQPFTDVMSDSAREVLSGISEFTNITFVETTGENADIVFGMADLSGDAVGLAAYPGAYSSGSSAADVWIDTSQAALSFEPGSDEYDTILHETLHSVGLQHADLPFGELSQQYTVMTSAGHPTMEVHASSPLLYDIAALQYLYGANTTATAGDDVYDFASLDNTITAIWDAGGHDTLDLSAATYGVAIDLREGSFSTVSGAGSNNVAMAFNTQIEDALGSAYGDEIVGNDADNYIYGGDGDDSLSGGEGADVFGFGGVDGVDRIHDFTSGQDKLQFGGPEASLEDLTIVLQENGILVEHSGGSVMIDNVEDLTEDDLLFAGA